MSSRWPAAVASAIGDRGTIAIRSSTAADRDALARLSGLADRQLPTGPLLVAEIDGELVAALAAGGELLADPFRVTLDVQQLLRLRARQLRAAA